jgi:ammonium transporter, Amt family
VAFYKAVIRPVGNPHGPKIPELVYALFQGMFACFTWVKARSKPTQTAAECEYRASLLSGATIFKERTHRFLIFIVFWTTLVYCPIAHWSWNPQGWSYRWGTYDFAGGTPVHICSGASAAAYGLFYKFRLRNHNSQQIRDVDKIQEEPFIKTRGYNIVSIVTGTAMLWIGWFGFNGGSALGANLRAVSACVSTSLAACSGGITAYLMDALYAYIKKVDPKPEDPLMTEADWLENRVEAVCAGVVVGMVAVTPAAGYVSWSRLTRSN